MMTLRMEYPYTTRCSCSGYKKNCIIGWETNRHYDRRMTFLETSLAVRVHLAGSSKTSCWTGAMKGILLSFLVRD